MKSIPVRLASLVFGDDRRQRLRLSRTLLAAAVFGWLVVKVKKAGADRSVWPPRHGIAATVRKLARDRTTCARA